MSGSNNRNGDLISILENFEPDLVLINVITASWYSANEIAKVIKFYDTSITISIGGVFPTLIGKIIYNSFSHFDIIVIGEGEYIIGEAILSFLKLGTFKRGVFESSKEVPIPKIDFNLVAENIKIIKDSNFPIETSRGCSFGCLFCYLRDFSKPLRYKNLNDLYSELQFLDSLGIHKLFFSDDNFDLNKRHCVKIVNFLKSFNFDIILETRLENVTKERIKDLKEAGVSEIIYGVEHIDLSPLSMMKKCEPCMRREWKKIANENTRSLNKGDITSHPIFMLGLPGETNGSLNNLVNFACELGKLDNVQYFTNWIRKSSSFIPISKYFSVKCLK